MRVFGITVGRNEAGRYLRSMLGHATAAVDEHFFFDDRSDDETADIAADYCTVGVRGLNTPSFLKHEGQFRQRAWEMFEALVEPELGDWVLAIDCDEALVSENDTYHRVRWVIEHAERMHAVAVILPIPEVFDVGENARPYVRTDGYWGGIRGSRLFAWRPGGRFSEKPMGSGSEPTYVANGPFCKENGGLYLMHYGYAHPADKQAKWERYTNLADNGHNDRHIQSIISEAHLVPWDGPWVEMRRGA